MHDMLPIQDGVYGSPCTLRRLDLSELELPSAEYAEYLTNTFYFAFSPLYYFFDRNVFFDNLRKFYVNQRSGGASEPTLWLVKMLLVFAFGQSILNKEAGPRGPTGYAYYAKAVESLPNPHFLFQDPVQAVEILCLLALFSQAIDMRFAGIQYVRIIHMPCIGIWRD